MQIGTLYYFGDPMCSWCWGFRPLLEQLEVEYPELRRTLVLGGLRGGEEVPMDDELAAMIQEAWARIHEVTGQPFDLSFWKDHRPLATTLPACRAVITARLLDAALEWRYMVGLFKAYFTEVRDPSRFETQLDVADAVGFGRGEFESVYRSAEAEQTLQGDLQTARRYRVSGFPTLILEIKDQAFLIAPGYQPIEVLRQSINRAYEKSDVEYTRPESGLYS